MNCSSVDTLLKWLSSSNSKISKLSNENAEFNKLLLFNNSQENIMHIEVHNSQLFVITYEQTLADNCSGKIENFTFRGYLLDKYPGGFKIGDSFIKMECETAYDERYGYLRNIFIRNFISDEENNALYVPEFALAQCKKIAANFKNISPGIREKIKMDIDILVLSSENFEQLLDKLQALGYEIKRGKNISVKAPYAERFVRLTERSLGENYTPETLEKRIAEREKFPAAVRAELANAAGIEYEFHLEISRTISAVQGLAYRPQKSRAQEIYNFENDNIIENLSKQILTIVEFQIDSREKLYAVAEDLENKIAETRRKISELESEISTSSASDNPEITRRRELIPQYIESLNADIECDRLKLSRVSDVIANYEQISGGDYIGNIVREQQAQAARVRQEKGQKSRIFENAQTEQTQNPRTETPDAPKKS